MLLRELVAYRRLNREQLVNRIGEVDCRTVQSVTGVNYQIEIQIVWNDGPGSAIRILGSIDDGGWRSWYPIGYTFLAQPASNQSDEMIVGEHK